MKLERPTIRPVGEISPEVPVYNLSKNTTVALQFFKCGSERIQDITIGEIVLNGTRVSFHEEERKGNKEIYIPFFKRSGVEWLAIEDSKKGTVCIKEVCKQAVERVWTVHLDTFHIAPSQLLGPITVGISFEQIYRLPSQGGSN